MANSLWDYLDQLENHRAPVTAKRNRIALTPITNNAPTPVFNPFVEEEQLPLAEKIALYDPFHPNQDGLGKYATPDRPVLNPIEQPIVQNNIPVATTPIAPPDELTEAENRVRQLEDFRNNPVENNDKGILGRIGDVLRQVVISGGQSYDRGIQQGRTPLESLAGAGGAAAAGGAYAGFNPDIDEKRQRLYDISKGQQDVDKIKSEREWKLGQDTRKAQLEVLKQKPIIEQRKLGQKDTELALRQSRQEFQKVNAEQKTALSSIMKRGYYKEGLNPDEDKKLEALGVVLPDFDSRKREVKEQAGKFYQRNPDTNQWEEANGLPEDASEVPIDFIIGGKNMKLRPRDIATIEASKERQQSQQTFTADQNERGRQHQTFLQTSRQNFDREKMEFDKAQKEAQNATTQEQKIAAEKRAEESKTRLLNLQTELEKELVDYKKSNP